MIYIGATEGNGSAIYFDIYSTERQGRGMRIYGTLGDGCYEGEVLVEVGRNSSVTFADAWLGGSDYAEFITRCDTELLSQRLLDAMLELTSLHGRRSLPHGNSPAYSSAVAESMPVWNSAP